MSIPAHSPLPWSSREDGEEPFVLYDANGTPVVVTLLGVIPRDEAEANTALVQRATAALTLLIGSLTAATHALRSYENGNDSPDLAKDIADHCDLVLVQMEGC